ncbi:pentatricopeptide repeat-containing protein At3g58590 [Carica papaya]|uniref:pentatricopeptide repeat-containing protein At3g58590 n=1 Tax=Carica papaya TaxID=3649 RepID=UPI000B8CC32D|nr:pentatricopeptide repeat-containing protein At3g58590 [Carica papaya]XP_021887188.1 pentatricopeptide repeat-containing protein At3g58590 [Carica papaya]
MNFHGDFFNHDQYVRNLLRACTQTPSIKATKALHALTITLAPYLAQPIFIYNNLLSLYGSMGQLHVASKVFDKMPDRNLVSFNSMISAYGRCGDEEEAWKLFGGMRGYGFSASQFTLGGLLSGDSFDIFRGVQLQGLSVKNGLFYADAFVGTALLGLYGRLGCLDEAVRTFEDIPRKSLVTWNAIISLFAQYGFIDDCMSMFRELVRMQSSLSECSFLGVLSGLSSERDLEIGQHIHCLVVKNGFIYEVTVVNSLLSMYVKCASLGFAEKIFEEAPVRDIVSWNTIMGALAKSESLEIALKYYIRMMVGDMSANQATYVSVITSCTSLVIPKFGQSIHANIIKNAFESDVILGSALVDFYAKCDQLEDAHCCFHDIHEKNVVSWNTLILGYANKFCSYSVSLLVEMLQSGFQPNEITFSAVLKSSSSLELRQLHCLITRLGYENNDYVLSSLMASYAKNFLMTDAMSFVDFSKAPISVVQSNIIAGIYNRSAQYYETIRLLSLLEEPDLVSWNIVIAACARSGNYAEVFELFRHMQLAQIFPDNYTFVSVLCVCSKLCNLALGSSIHCLIIKTNSSLCDTFLCNILIDMYGKCGSIRSSVKIFDEMTDRNLITWTALISALGVHGYVREAFDRFREMESLGFDLDGVAFLSILSVCRHGGLVREGMEIFRKMHSSYGIEPDIDHYHCVIDMLVRCGCLRDAEQLISSMPFPPNALIWRSFLGGCKRYGTVGTQEAKMET